MNATTLRSAIPLLLALPAVAAMGCSSDSASGGDPSLVDSGDDSGSEVAPPEDGTSPCPSQDVACSGKCGQLHHTCGALFECGGCAAEQTCGGGGVANVCGVGTCTPSCSGKACGDTDGCSDACTGTSECGSARLLVTFGGYDGSGYRNDTWTFDGSTWSAITVATPPPKRDAHAMATLGSKVVLFGGFFNPGGFTGKDVYLNDTWTFDGTAWAQVAAASAPPARTNPAIASLGGKIVMFGGDDATDTQLGDTWIFDGTTWTRVTAPGGPSARSRAAMAPLAGKLVLFGGYDGSKSLDDQWTFDGTTWASSSVDPKPSARSAHVMAQLGAQIVLYGGYGTATLQDTWRFDGKQWTAVTSAGPVLTGSYSMSRLGSELTLLGPTPAAWNFDGTAWVRVPFTSTAGFAYGFVAATLP